MNFKIYIFFLFAFFENVVSFRNKLIIPIIKNDIGLFMKPRELINYFTSFRDYTIITVGDENKNIYNLFENEKINIYYMNLDNIFDKNEILYTLRNDHKNIESGADFWLFYQGHYIGGKEVVTKIINKNKNKIN